MVDTADLGSEVFNRINDIPSTLSVGSVKTFIEFSIKDVQNYTGDTISASSVPDKYQNILINLGCAYVIGRKIGVGVASSFELGEFSADRSDLGNSEDALNLKFYLDQATNSMKWIGRKVHIKKAWGV